MTPEGRVKSLIKKALAKYDGRIYYFMPVPYGYGKSTLDFIGCFCGLFFAIEAKRPKKDLTTRQAGTRDDMHDAGGVVFHIDSEERLGVLVSWLEAVDEAEQTASSSRTD